LTGLIYKVLLFFTCTYIDSQVLFVCMKCDQYSKGLKLYLRSQIEVKRLPCPLGNLHLQVNLQFGKDFTTEEMFEGGSREEFQHYFC
jgi:hypothetical protein